MSKTIEFRVPVRDGSTETRQGRIVWLMIGGRKIKCVLQKGDILTHYASGYILGYLNRAAIELMCRLTPQHRFTPKQLAEAVIAKAVARKGMTEVLAKIDAAPVLNV